MHKHGPTRVPGACAMRIREHAAAFRDDAIGMMRGCIMASLCTPCDEGVQAMLRTRSYFVVYEKINNVTRICVGEEFSVPRAARARERSEARRRRATTERARRPTYVTHSGRRRGVGIHQSKPLRACQPPFHMPFQRTASPSNARHFTATGRPKLTKRDRLFAEDPRSNPCNRTATAHRFTRLRIR